MSSAIRASTVLVGHGVGRVQRRRHGQQRDQFPGENVSSWMPVSDEIGMIASQSRSSLTACSCSATAGRAARIHLGDDRDLFRPRKPVELLVDVPVSRTDLLVGRHAEADDVDLGERVLHDVFRRSPSSVRGRCIPGVSTTISWPAFCVHDASDGAPRRLRFG